MVIIVRDFLIFYQIFYSHEWNGALLLVFNMCYNFPHKLSNDVTLMILKN